MLKKLLIISALISTALISGCASVPMASNNQDSVMKTFKKPKSDKAGLYIFRDTFRGQGFKKTIYLDGVAFAETANNVYFYVQLAPGKHTLATETDFKNHSITFEVEGGKNYFAEQFIIMSLTQGIAGIKMVDEDTGKRGVLNTELGFTQPITAYAFEE